MPGPIRIPNSPSAIMLVLSTFDSVIAMLPFTGMHWLWEIVSMVINKTSEYDRNPKEACMMDFRTKEQLESVSEPMYVPTA